MRRVPAVSLLLCGLLVLGACGVGTAFATVASDGSVGHGEVQPLPTTDRSPVRATTDPETIRELQQEFDRTEFRITIHTNGSAEWTFRFQRTLSNDTERSDFREYADQFNNESTPLYDDFQRRARTLTVEGANATGRPMTATGFEKRAFVDTLGNQGVVELTFHWIGFASVDDDGTVTVGDVFEGGLYIRTDQRLVVRRGPGVAFGSASPDPDSVSGDSLSGSDSITWGGERAFTDERPRIVLVPPASATASPTGTVTVTGDPAGGSGQGGTKTATDGRDSPTRGSPASSGGGGLGLFPAVALGAVVLLGLGAAVAYRAGAFDGASAVASEDDGDDGAGSPPAGAAAADEDGSASAPPDPAITDEELLSDEDRVMGLIDERGGRMKQVDIVQETGWSKSKVSMLLSEMEEDGQISKLRVGRENIISKKGMEPEAAGSPFDEED